jgi:hypothetical protein
MKPRRRDSKALDSQKKLEKRAIEAVRAIDPVFPEGEIVPGKAGHEPDFVIETGRGRHGFEIVECFRPSIHAGVPVAAQESFTAEMTRQITRECKRVNLSNVSASVEFDHCVLLAKCDTQRIVRHLVKLIEPVAAGKPPRLRICHSPKLPLGVCDLLAHHRQSIREPFVGLRWGGPVPVVDETALRELIRGKERKFTTIYPRNCSRVWLVVVVNQLTVATMAYVPGSFAISASSFERIVVLQGWSDVIEIWNTAA